MDCAETKPLLPSYARDDLGGPDRDAVAEHLAACDDCSLAIDLLRHPPATPAETAADWTVEKIFAEGSEGSGGAGDEPEASAATEPNALSLPEPDPAPPAPHPTPSLAPDAGSASAPALPPASANAAPADAPSGPEAGDWEFEPAGANVENAPPGESLQLAEEALGRRRGRSQSRNAAIRALAWGLGGVAGLGLLGASIWVAVTVRPAATGGDAASRAPQPHLESPAPPPPDAEPPAAHPTPAPTSATAGPMIAGTSSETAAPPAGSGLPPQAAVKSPAIATTSTAPIAEKPAVPSPPKAAAPAPAPRHDTRAPAPEAGSERVAATTGPAKAAPPASTASPAGTTSRPGAAASPPADARPAPDDLDMWPVDDVVMPAPAVTTPPAMTAPEKTLVKDDPPAAPPASAPAGTAAAPPESAQTASPKPKAPQTALGRLHEATEKAAGEADLDALRRLREAWKNHLKTAVGPTRSRAKREYADCLWAIQLLTGRQDDQREALLAYRDFLLSAPAGGADPRSAARLRQLEDVLVERR